MADRIKDSPNVEVLLNTEVKAMHGNGYLSSVELVNRKTGEVRTIRTPALFSFIGATPRTEWLPAEIERDEKGFILTGTALGLDRRRANCRGPFLLETSHPGVFAAGDGRSGSIKRVASAVGEGAMAVQFVHEFLRDQGHAVIGHDAQRVPPTGQQPLQVPRVQLAVLRHEDAQRCRGPGGRVPPGRGGRHGVEPIRGVWRPPEPGREGEGAAAARFALHVDRAAHQVDQPGGDRQAQSGAAELARRGAVDLLERPEDPPPALGRDADAGVAHLESEDDLSVGRLALREVHTHGHPAPPGELDRGADQVEQHLP